jgi:GNAT superfamily N-acetyltransferase
MRSRVPEPTAHVPDLVVEDAPDAADLALLEEQVAAAAIAAAGLGDEREFGIFGRDDDGRVVAGISAIVWGGYCELQALWVEESLRNRGLAHALFAGAEAEARRRGCALVVFHAYDVLARVSTSGSDTRLSVSSRTARREALRAGTARSCERALRRGSSVAPAAGPTGSDQDPVDQGWDAGRPWRFDAAGAWASRRVAAQVHDFLDDNGGEGAAGGARRGRRLALRRITLLYATPLCAGPFPRAPERTRTSTDHSVHKALNPNHSA